jgi:hypothetical protein
MGVFAYGRIKLAPAQDQQRPKVAALFETTFLQRSGKLQIKSLLSSSQRKKIKLKRVELTNSIFSEMSVGKITTSNPFVLSCISLVTSGHQNFSTVRTRNTTRTTPPVISQINEVFARFPECAISANK